MLHELHCLTTGHVRTRVAERGLGRYVGDAWGDETVPVHAFLFEHPDGLCLFDAGQTARAASRGYLPRWHPFLRLARFELGRDDEIAPQLSRRGLFADDVRWVVLSHLHTDHVGCLDSFAHAEVLVSESEWRRARGLRGRLGGYVPQHWPDGLDPRLVAFDGPPVGPFAASADIAGDGRLIVVPTPGHTPGHVSMLVRTSGGKWLLGGDLAASAAALAEVAPEVSRFCSLEGITFLAAHDPLAAAPAATTDRPHTFVQP